MQNFIEINQIVAEFWAKKHMSIDVHVRLIWLIIWPNIKKINKIIVIW